MDDIGTLEPNTTLIFKDNCDLYEPSTSSSLLNLLEEFVQRKEFN